MKISYIDENNILIFINNELINDIDFNDIEETKDYFKELFIHIKNELKLKINGFYFVKVYKDKYYGIVIEIEKEEMDFYDYYIDEIDMHITLEERTFLYQIDDIFINKNILKKSDVLLYNKKVYLRIKEEINSILKGYLFEIGKLIYKDTNDIIKYSKILDYNVV